MRRVTVFGWPSGSRAISPSASALTFRRRSGINSPRRLRFRSRGNRMGRPSFSIETILKIFPLVPNPTFPRWFQILWLALIASGLFLFFVSIYFTWEQSVQSSKPPQIGTTGIKYLPSPTRDATPQWPAVQGLPNPPDGRRLIAWATCLHNDNSDTAYVTVQNATELDQVIVEVVADVSRYTYLMHGPQFVMSEIATIGPIPLPQQGRVSFPLRHPISIPRNYTHQFAIKLECPGGQYEFTLTFKTASGEVATTQTQVAG
jgi:hypothetical protein